jgi:hypothetical protein
VEVSIQPFWLGSRRKRSWRELRDDNETPLFVNADCVRRTIWSIPYETTPTPLGGLDESDFDLDFADDETRLFRVDLTLQGLQIQLFVAVLVQYLS